MLTIIGVIALSLASTGPAANAKIPEPRGNLAGVFLYSDYPTEALQKNQQGDVGVSLHINATGAISDCIVEKSSGSAILDTRTCDVIRKRATFKPALDSKGRGIESQYHQTIHWRIAENELPSDPWVWRKVIDFDSFREVKACQIDLEGAIQPKSGTPPPRCPQGDMKWSVQDNGQFGHPVDRVIMEQRFTPGLASVPPLGPDQEVAETIVVQLNIDASGKLTSCKMTEQAGPKPPADPCLAVKKSYTARKGPDGKPAPFVATQIMTTRAHVDRSQPPEAAPLNGSLQGLFASDDYPDEALDNDDQGQVGIAIRTDPKGAITDCVVEETSKSKVLDKQTCEIVRKRAKFKPALDRQGRAAAGEYRSRIVWKIEDELTPSDPWAVRWVTNYAPDGRTLSCRMEFEGAMTPQPGTTPPACDADAPPNAAPKVADLPGAIGTLVIEERFVPGRLSAPSIPEGDILVSRQVISLEVDVDGNLTSCKVVESSGSAAADDPCSQVDKKYSLHKGLDGKPAPFSAIEIITLYVRVEKVALGKGDARSRPASAPITNRPLSVLS